MEFKIPQLKIFKKKEEVTDSSSSFEEKIKSFRKK
jgi:type IV secretion system protein VirB8